VHICFVNMPIEYYSPVSGGAIATIIAQTGRALVDVGHRVTVLTPVDGNTTYDVGTVVPLAVKRREELSFVQRRWSDVRRRLGGWDWPYFEHYLASVKRALSKLRVAPDAVVMFNDLYTAPHVKRIVPGARVAVWLQNEWRTAPGNLPATVAATDVFLTCSGYIRDWTAREHGIPLAKFAVAPSGVDLAAFTPRADFDAPVSRPRVLFVGRIDRNKGPDIAVDAVTALRARGIELPMTVAGGLWFYGGGDSMSDPFFRELRGKMDRVGADYLGHVPRGRIAEVMREHDIVCVLSRSNEPFGLVVLEAMASGCAVISSNRGGLPEACGDAGRLVDPDDLDAVIAALGQWATDPIALVGEKRRSLARARQAPWSVSADLLLNALSLTKLTTTVGAAAA
jgi:glycosyltransferase involved in cell wall biosynthesis